MFSISGGRKYVGEWRSGEKHGQGTYTWSNGEKYVGEWKNGKFDGQGTYTFGKGNGKETNMKGSGRRMKNMVKENTLPLLEESI